MVRAVGITNQRESTIVWDKTTGHSIYPAISKFDDSYEVRSIRLKTEKHRSGHSSYCSGRGRGQITTFTEEQENLSVPVTKFPFPRDNLRSPARTAFT